ncbi:MAG: RCC1 domain-containing protein, partial [Myxococcaceae bacterium]
MPARKVVSVSAGGDLLENSSTCAVVDNEVSCWGSNLQGKLGQGESLERLTPFDVPNLTGVTRIATGSNHTCALTQAGGIKCWGSNSRNQLGNASGVFRSLPADVPGLTSGVTALGARGSRTCVLQGGLLKCFGQDDPTPKEMPGFGAGVRSFSVGLGYVCAVTAAGGAKCLGSNASGELGNGTLVAAATATDVTGLTSNVLAVAAGYSTTCAVLQGGGVRCWGANDGNQLGNGSTTGRPNPVTPNVVANVVGISVGDLSVIAWTQTGVAVIWGGYIDNQGQYVAQPTQATLYGAGTTSAAAGASSFCVLNAGTAVCEGYNT